MADEGFGEGVGQGARQMLMPLAAEGYLGAVPGSELLGHPVYGC